jgi:hypothetical protein
MATVSITNTYWNSINLQVRTGNNPNPENNPIVYNNPLARGQTVPFTFPVFLFYRRDANPDYPNGTFTGWTQCFTNENIDNP